MIYLASSRRWLNHSSISHIPGYCREVLPKAKRQHEGQGYRRELATQLLVCCRSDGANPSGQKLAFGCFVEISWIEISYYRFFGLDSTSSKLSNRLDCNPNEDGAGQVDPFFQPA